MPTKPDYKRFAAMLVDQTLADRIRGSDKGTMKADLTIVRQVVEAKLADPKFRERFANELVGSGALSFKAGR